MILTFLILYRVPPCEVVVSILGNPRSNGRCISRIPDKSVSQRMSNRTSRSAQNLAPFVCLLRLSRLANRHRWQRQSYDRPLTRHRSRYISVPHTSSSACFRRLRTSRLASSILSKSIEASPINLSNSSGVTARRYSARFSCHASRNATSRDAIFDLASLINGSIIGAAANSSMITFTSSIVSCLLPFSEYRFSI